MKGFFILAFALCSGNAFGRSLIDEVMDGKSCKTSVANKNQINCTYEIGKILRVEIAGIGEHDAQFAVFKADIDKTYWAAFGLGIQCVMIKKAATVDIAFISPKNGKVYGDSTSCSLAK